MPEALAPDPRPLPVPGPHRRPPAAVDLDTVQGVSVGLHGRRLELFGKGGGPSSAPARALAEQRLANPAGDQLSGWLEKFGGAHGGARSWHRRWCVLSGSTLLYFKSPGDAKYNGFFALSGAVAQQAPESDRAIVISWGGGEGAGAAGAGGDSDAEGDDGPAGAGGSGKRPDRELRAGSAEECAMWLAALRRAMRIDRLISGAGRPAGAVGRRGGAAAEPEAVTPFDFAPPITVPEPQAGAVSLSFLGPAPAGGAKEPVALVVGSVLSTEQWYFGILAAIAIRQKLTFAQQEQRHRAAVARSAADLPAKLALALALEQRGGAAAREEALMLARSVCQADRFSPLAAKVAGRLLLEGGDAKAALPLLRAAAALYQLQDGASLLLLARAYRVGKSRLAQHCFRAALAVDPRDVMAHLELGLLLLDELNQPGEALQHLRAASKADRKAPGTRLALARALAANGEHSEAANEFKELLAFPSLAWPLQRDALQGRARSLGAQGQFSDATEPLAAIVKASGAGAAVAVSGDEHTAALLELASVYTNAALAKAPRFGAAAASSAGKAASAGSGGDSDEDDPKLSTGGASATPRAAIPPAVDVAAVLSVPAARVAAMGAAELLQSCEALASAALVRVPGLSAALEARAAARELLGSDAESRAAGTGTALLAAAEADFAAVAPATATSRFGLGRIAKRAGRLEDAARELAAATKLDGSLAEAADLLARVQRLQRGEPEVAPPASPRAKKTDEVQFMDVGASLPLADMAGLSADERQAEFFRAIKADKKRKEDEEKEALRAKLAKLTPEELAAYEAEQEEKERHEAKKDKVINRQLGQYGGAGKAAALLSARGRGRGRGR